MDQTSDERARSGWILDQAGQDLNGSDRMRSRWIKRKEVFVSSSNSTSGALEGDQLSKHEEKPKRAKLMRKPKRAK